MCAKIIKKNEFTSFLCSKKGEFTIIVLELKLL